MHFSHSHIFIHSQCTACRHNLTGVLEGALRSSNAQYEPSFVLDRIGVRLLEVCTDIYSPCYGLFRVMYVIDCG